MRSTFEVALNEVHGSQTGLKMTVLMQYNTLKIANKCEKYRRINLTKKQQHRSMR
jgi:hypothetical protein